mmetsp:Transcript_27301/g.50108  ORF Transcript_27301/g.50108 Transcript_27301/m.50108 type:complete len:215 (-) Transcript_27301:36-680(-)
MPDVLEKVLAETQLQTEPEQYPELLSPSFDQEAEDDAEGDPIRQIGIDHCNNFQQRQLAHNLIELCGCASWQPRPRDLSRQSLAVRTPSALHSLKQCRHRLQLGQKICRQGTMLAAPAISPHSTAVLVLESRNPRATLDSARVGSSRRSTLVILISIIGNTSDTLLPGARPCSRDSRRCKPAARCRGRDRSELAAGHQQDQRCSSEERLLRHAG